MKTYRFNCKSTRGGFTEWISGYEDGKEIKRVDRDVTLETVRQFRERVAPQFEAEGFTCEENQYTL